MYKSHSKAESFQKVKNRTSARSPGHPGLGKELNVKSCGGTNRMFAGGKKTIGERNHHG